MTTQGPLPLRILAVGETRHGTNAHAFIRAFRRSGHSVEVIADEYYGAPAWTSRRLKALRRAIQPMLVREGTHAIRRAVQDFRPHLLFVFLGSMVTPQAILAAQEAGAVAINFWPDISITAHGKWPQHALPLYDWVFSTKRFGLADMERLLDVRRASYMPHAFDPETHRPSLLDETDRARYSCDVSFIGTWSPKKEHAIRAIHDALPDARMRVWGRQWRRAAPGLETVVEGRSVWGVEYAKAVGASRINLALLSEARGEASGGDTVTSRSFHIPASGGFMLHERTVEAQRFFTEGLDCAMFGDRRELVAKVRYFLAHAEERVRLATGGRARVLSDDHSADNRVREIVAKARALLNEKSAG
ncbi:MAG: glycosyltransferase [Methylobacterium mesophilicum]|nr:glycosyltransferase [Methylobacterium mesophilicum]